LASAGTNLHYGISKGADAASSVAWGAVSVAVSIVFALSWPAVIKAVERRQWTLAPMAAAALVLTGAYSVTAALGSASGGRMNAAALETATTDARTKAQAAYAIAKSELDALKSSRPIGELEALVAAYAPVRKCRIQIGSRSTICSLPTTLAGELGRARRRAELETKMDAAQAELERVAAPRQANSDAAALAGYFAALGLNVQTDAVNRLLVLLAVLVIECGGGLALAVGMSLSEHRAQGVREQVFAEQPVLRSPPLRMNTSNTNRAVRHRSRSRKAVGERLLEVLRERGGPMQTSIRRLAHHLGTSPTTLHTAAGELMAAGVVSVIGGRQGSEFRLLR
jgi:hypothetical protein